jgi:phosphomannomutase
MKILSTIFKEYDIRGKYPAELNENTAYALGLAFAKISKAKKMIVGRDARKESEMSFWPLVLGLMEGGVKVDDLGVCATPELFFAVGAKRYSAGCMVTASHSPQGETGFKFCDESGIVYGLKTGLKKLAAQAGRENRQYSATGLKKKINSIDFTSIATEYKKFALSFVKPSGLKNLKIVLDASSGSGAHLSSVVFNSLPVELISMNFRAKDNYLDHGPNPLLKENQLPIIKEIVASRADLGVIFDGDADRAIFFDETGRLIEPYYINCLLSEIILKSKRGLTVAIDARLTLALSETIKKNGGKVFRQRSGYANFIKTMSRKQLLFGCENSGHFMINFKLKNKQSFVYGDAIIPILLILSYLKSHGLKISRAINSFKGQYLISGELNFKTEKFEAISKILKKNFSAAKIDSIDGLSVFGPNKEWFFNLRSSHTEPLIRLNIEAKNSTRLNQLKDELVSIIKTIEYSSKNKKYGK